MQWLLMPVFLPAKWLLPNPSGACTAGAGNQGSPQTSAPFSGSWLAALLAHLLLRPMLLALRRLSSLYAETKHSSSPIANREAHAAAAAAAAAPAAAAAAAATVAQSPFALPASAAAAAPSPAAGPAPAAAAATAPSPFAGLASAAAVAPASPFAGPAAAAAVASSSFPAAPSPFAGPAAAAPVASRTSSSFPVAPSPFAAPAATAFARSPFAAVEIQQNLMVRLATQSAVRAVVRVCCIERLHRLSKSWHCVVCSCRPSATCHVQGCGRWQDATGLRTHSGASGIGGFAHRQLRRSWL